tara:strand:+ start:769 stop:957 length:189 start_codon:yes stop_codon:yes gene_type:complete
MTMSEALTALGEDLPSHARPNAAAEQILQGADLVLRAGRLDLIERSRNILADFIRAHLVIVL